MCELSIQTGFEFRFMAFLCFKGKSNIVKREER